MLYEAVLLFAVAFFAAWLFFFVSGGKDATTGALRYALQLFIFTVFAAYFLWCWLRGGQTLAMKAWHIRLVDVTPARALLRLVLAALLRRQRGPALHAALHALLLLGLHRRIALGDADPLAAALGFQALPVGLERRQRLLLLGGELGPRRARHGFGLRRRLGGRLFRRDLGRYVDRRLCRSRPGEDEGEQEPEAPHHSSAAPARFFSQFWNPRSR